MLEKLAGLPTQIRDLERRLKELDTKKIKPTVIKELTDTIKNLKELLKEKMDKKEQRKKDKANAVPHEIKKEVSVEAATPGSMGATAPNANVPKQVGQPESTAITQDNNKMSCPLCGGMSFNEQSAYQQHMQFTHASNTMPTTPGQKLDKTVAAVEPGVEKEAGPKCAICAVDFKSFPEYEAHKKEMHPAQKEYTPMDRGQKREVVKNVEDRLGPAIISEQEGSAEPMFKLDDEVKPIRGSESIGRVMRWDGKLNDLVYVIWSSGPLAERDAFGGYYAHDLELVKKEPVAPAPVEAAIEPPCPCKEDVAVYCPKCKNDKTSDLKSNYMEMLKDLKEEREAHYNQGNHAWVARLDKRISDLGKSIEERFNKASEKEAAGGPRLIRQINKAVSGHGYEATEYDLANGRFKQYVPVKINETQVRMTDPTKTQFEAKYDGSDWKMLTPEDFNEWLAEWKTTNETNRQKEGSAQNAEHLTVMDHTPAPAVSSVNDGGESKDEFQDEWAMPVTGSIKLAVFDTQFDVTPINNQDKLAGYDISQDGKKLFNISSKDSQPMSKKQLQFCAQIELSRGMKQAKLTAKIAFLEEGSRIYVVAEDKIRKRIKFASLAHGVRGWCPTSKVAFLIKEGQMMRHKDHIDNTFGHNSKEILVDCPNGSGNMLWLPIGELLSINPPPATPESLNDLESVKEKGFSEVVRPQPGDHMQCSGCGKSFKNYDELKVHDKVCLKASAEEEEDDMCPKCDKGVMGNARDAQNRWSNTCNKCGYSRVMKQAVKECPDCKGTFVGNENETCPTCERFAVSKEALKQQLPSLIMNQRRDSNASLNKVASVVHREDGWRVLSEKGKNLGGPYDSKHEAVQRLREVEYFKNASLRPFSKKAEVLSDPYGSLTTHITEMRGRMDAVQEKIQSVPAIKTAGEQDTSELDLPGLFADLTQGIELLETKLGEKSKHHDEIEELENKLWTLEESLGLTPEISEEERAEPEHKEVVAKAALKSTAVNNNRKYSLTNESKTVDGVVVYRIKLHQTGQLGGFIQSENNLSQSGNAVVYDDAVVYGNAVVSGNAFVYNDAVVSGNARVYGYVVVYGNAVVSGDVAVYGSAKVHDSAQVFGNARVFDNAQVFGNAAVYDDAVVSGNAIVYGDAQVSGDTIVSGNTTIIDNTQPEAPVNQKDLSKEATSVEFLDSEGAPSQLPSLKKWLNDHFKSPEQMEQQLEALALEWAAQNGFRMDHDGDTLRFVKKSLNVSPDFKPKISSKIRGADQVTDDTILNQPAQAIKNIQPTDYDNLAVPVVAPTSPLPPGQKWVFDTQFNKYVAMPDPQSNA